MGFMGLQPTTDADLTGAKMDQVNYIRSLVQDIDSSTKMIDETGSNDHKEARTQALESARKLVAALATPTETILHHSYEVRS